MAYPTWNHERFAFTVWLTAHVATEGFTGLRNAADYAILRCFHGFALIPKP